MANRSEERQHMWGSVFPGIILLAMGVIFLLNNYGFTTFDLGKLWPIFLIIPGAYMIMGLHKKG